MPAVGLAQSRVGVTVNAGTQATSTAFMTRSTHTLHREDGDLRADYGVDAGALIDLGASVRLWRQVGLGVGVSRFQSTGCAGVTAGLPQPFHLEQFRAVDGSAAATRQETAVHVQLRVGATVGPRLEVTLFGGPTFFDVEQTLVSDILFEETYPYDTAPFSSAPTVLRSVTAVGFHTGVDLATYLTPTVGVGALVRFSRAAAQRRRHAGGGDWRPACGWRSAPTILIGTHGDRFLLLANHGGAVNEAFSDIIGTAVEFSVHAPGAGPLLADYVTGEDTGQPIRSITLNENSSIPYPDAYSRRVRFIIGVFEDNGRYFFSNIGSVDGRTIVTLPGADSGGVHWNSTILSHAFYLAIEGGRNEKTGRTVQGVGTANRHQVEQVFFRAMTALMPSQTNFAITDAVIRQSAVDLFGLGTATQRAVYQALDALDP